MFRTKHLLGLRWQLVTSVCKKFMQVISLIYYNEIKPRSSCQKVFCKKAALGIFAKFTEKHLCQGLFLIKLQAEACNVIKKETLAQVFFYEFHKISKNTFFAEYIWVVASINQTFGKSC